MAHDFRRTLLSDSTQQLKALSKKLGSCIEKARPFYEALEVAQKAQKECQVNFSRPMLGLHRGFLSSDTNDDFVLTECRDALPTGEWHTRRGQGDDNAGRAAVPH